MDNAKRMRSQCIGALFPPVADSCRIDAMPDFDLFSQKYWLSDAIVGLRDGLVMG